MMKKYPALVACLLFLIAQPIGEAKSKGLFLRNKRISFESIVVQRELASAPVAVFWMGFGAATESGIGLPAMADVIKGYSARGYRSIIADNLLPHQLYQLIANDRKLHPWNYSGATIPLVIHGRGFKIGSESRGEPTVLDALLSAGRNIRAKEVIEAFSDAIGEKATGDVIFSACFGGTICESQGFQKLVFGERLIRVMAMAQNPKPNAGVLESKSESILRRIRDLILLKEVRRSYLFPTKILSAAK